MAHGYSIYPQSYDSYTYKVNITDFVNAIDVNELQDGLESVQQTLGVNPQGNKSTLADRLNTSMDSSGNITTSSTSADSFQIDSDGTSTTPYFSFGGGYDKRLTWNNNNTRFEFGGDGYFAGALSIASTLSGITTLTASTGNITTIVSTTVGATTGNITTVNSTTVSATTGNFTNGIGVFPLKGVVAVFLGLAGNNPSTTDGWALCNGTTAASQGVSSPTVTNTLPNVNSGAFVRGSTSSWTTGSASGGADSVTISSANLPTHTHDINHTHGTFTSGGKSATHTHTGTSGGVSATHTHTVNSHTHTFTSSSSGAHTHGEGTIEYKASGYNYGLTGSSPSKGTTFGEQGADAAHTHTGTTDGTAPGTGAESANHTHTTTTGVESADHTHSTAITALGTTSSGNGGFANTATATLPVYFSAVYYMRVK